MFQVPKSNIPGSWMKVNFPENPENYSQGSWGPLKTRDFPDHPEMKIFTLFLGIKVLITSNFMDSLYRKSLCDWPHRVQTGWIGMTTVI
jgi:hypothetical protein